MDAGEENEMIKHVLTLYSKEERTKYVINFIRHTRLNDFSSRYVHGLIKRYPGIFKV